jgi:hypothetical protein
MNVPNPEVKGQVQVARLLQLLRDLDGLEESKRLFLEEYRKDKESLQNCICKSRLEVEAGQGTLFEKVK